MVNPKRYSSPINKCFKSYPVLSLRKVPSISSTVPLAKTTSRPEMSVLKAMFKKEKIVKININRQNDNRSHTYEIERNYALPYVNCPIPRCSKNHLLC